MKIALMILFLILFLFAVIYPSDIYPSRVRKRIKKCYEEIDISNYEGYVFRVRAGVYFDCVFSVLFMGFFFILGLLLLIVPVIEINVIVLIMSIFAVILFGATTFFYMAKLLYFLPRRSLVYRNRMIYYREGRKERSIDMIKDISSEHNSKSNYWTLRIKIPDEEKSFTIDFMSFNNPEIIYKIILSKLDREYKREIILKSIMR